MSRPSWSTPYWASHRFSYPNLNCVTLRNSSRLAFVNHTTRLLHFFCPFSYTLPLRSRTLFCASCQPLLPPNRLIHVVKIHDHSQPPHIRIRLTHKITKQYINSSLKISSQSRKPLTEGTQNIVFGDTASEANWQREERTVCVTDAKFH